MPIHLIRRVRRLAIGMFDKRNQGRENFHSARLHYKLWLVTTRGATDRPKISHYRALQAFFIFLVCVSLNVP